MTDALATIATSPLATTGAPAAARSLLLDVAAAAASLVTAATVTVQKRRYILVEGWQCIASLYGCGTVVTQVEELPDGSVRAVAQVRRLTDGVVLAEAEGFVGMDEPRWASAERYAARAMAQTRAISRACRGAFAHVVLAMNANHGTDLAMTPAEEVPPDGFDRPSRPPRQAGGDARDRTGAEVAQARPTVPAGVSATQAGPQSVSAPATTVTQEAGTIPAGTTTPQQETAEQARRKRRTHAELLVELRESLTDSPQTSEDLARRVGIEIATAKKLLGCLPATILRTSVVGDRTVYQAQGPVPADPTLSARPESTGALTHCSTPAASPPPVTAPMAPPASATAPAATARPTSIASGTEPPALTPPPTPPAPDPYKAAAHVYSRALAGLHGCGPGTSLQQLRDRFAAAKGQSLADLEAAAYALLGTDLQDAWAKGLPVVAAQVGVTEREMSERLWQRLAEHVDGMGMDGLLHAQASFIESAVKTDPMQTERF